MCNLDYKRMAVDELTSIIFDIDRIKYKLYSMVNIDGMVLLDDAAHQASELLSEVEQRRACLRKDVNEAKREACKDPLYNATDAYHDAIPVHSAGDVT